MGGEYVSIVTNNGDDAMDETNDAVRVNIVASSGTVDTELPAAAALADATANPTAPAVAAMAELYNGATWDRMRGDTTNGLDVDVTRLPTAGYGAPVTVTRPANATPYAAGDVVGGAITFPTMGPSASHIIITSAALEIDVAAIPAGMTSFQLALYNVTPPSAIADNGVWDLPSGDRASYLGLIDIGTPVDRGSTLTISTDGINRQRKLAGTSLFGYLITVGGFTPAGNSEVYVVALYAVAV